MASTCTALDPPCVASSVADVGKCVASSTNIVLKDIHAPPKVPIDLRALKTGSTVTFSGNTLFDPTPDYNFVPIVISGAGVTITAEKDAIINGNGHLLWDSFGSNPGGKPKPNYLISANKMTAGSVIKNLHIISYPSHCFSIYGADGLTIQDIFLDNRAGDAPSGTGGKGGSGHAMAHNSDGFDVASSNNVIIKNCVVYNQDDCVAVSSGDNITVDGVKCFNGNGITIGSVGGKQNNKVTNVIFTNSEVFNSRNGVHMKSNHETTGFVSNITYSNIKLTNIKKFGIDVQQDYLNSGSTGHPTNGVIFQNVLFENVTGTITEDAQKLNVLCGTGSCKNFRFSGVELQGSSAASSCNYPKTGCPV